MNNQDKWTDLNHLAEWIAIDYVRASMEKCGHKKFWQFIERTKNPVRRARMRILYFKAGGRIPKGR